MICIIENSPGLSVYFENFLLNHSVLFTVFPVYKNGLFPEKSFKSYIFTGDFSNISDGLKPYHLKEIEFIKSIKESKIFGSCFSHQLISKIFGGVVSRRSERHFGWNRINLIKAHRVLINIDDPYFISMNGDEISKISEKSELIGTSKSCHNQIISYNDNILTMQSHPEMLIDDVKRLTEIYRNELSDRCPFLDEVFKKTVGFSDDDVNWSFMKNLVSWLTE